MKNFIHAVVAFAVLATAAMTAAAQQQPTTPAPVPGAGGWYYNNPNGPIPPAANIGSPVQPNSVILQLGAQRTDATIDFTNPGTSGPAGMTDHRFNITWLGTITIPANGVFWFRGVTDDGGRLWISRTLPLTAASMSDTALWKDQGDTNIEFPIGAGGAPAATGMTCTAGEKLYFRFEMYENQGGNTARLLWRTPASGTAYVVIPALTALGGGMETPGPCPTPTLTAQSVGGATQIRLDWVDPGPVAGQTHADSYNIYRGTVTGTPPARVLIANTTANTFTDTGAAGPLVFGQTYFYVVQGIYSAGILVPPAPAATPTLPSGMVFGNPSNESACAVNPFAITPASLLVIENGGVGTITITTSAAIPNGVTVSFPITVTTVGGGTSFTVVSPAVMTGNNTVGQSLQVSITGVPNQRANDPKTASVQFGPSQSADAGFNNHTFPPITCTQIESDIPGVIINPASGLAITNGGTPITFTVALATIPDFDVNMTTSSTIPYAAVISPPSLTFTSGNWSNPQTVTVTPNNVDTTTNYLTSFYVDFTPVTSTDANYDGINPGRAYIFEATSTPPLESVWGSSSGCGLMGAEALLVLAFAALRRRRRST